jgi:DNA repair exonuclease SbcCD ATPase subunit
MTETTETAAPTSREEFKAALAEMRKMSRAFSGLVRLETMLEKFDNLHHDTARCERHLAGLRSEIEQLKTARSQAADDAKAERDHLEVERAALDEQIAGARIELARLTAGADAEIERRDAAQRKLDELRGTFAQIVNAAA